MEWSVNEILQLQQLAGLGQTSKPKEELARPGQRDIAHPVLLEEKHLVRTMSRGHATTYLLEYTIAPPTLSGFITRV
jgi:hypothetical protein